MSSLYSAAHRALQADFGTEKLATFLDANHVHAGLTAEDKAFIAQRDMFFLSTVDPDGHPTVSYKGGASGFVRVLDEATIAFPDYDGNGMYLSLGNIAGQAKVGLLFIDFETPNRLRLQGSATLSRTDPLLASWAGAKCVVRVDVSKVWVNCPRYIHTYRKLASSRYVPKAEGAPLAGWKRLDIVQDVLPEADRARAAAEGVLDLDTYAARLARGEA